MRNEYDDELSSYEEEAEDRYRDYNDEESYEDEFDSGFEGNEDVYDGYEEEEIEYIPAGGDHYPEYDNYKASSIGRIDPNDRTLTVIVTNSGATPLEAILFGGNENAAQAVGVVVDVAESSHSEVREESKSNPFKITGMKMSVSNALQFDNVLRITRRTSTGSTTSRVYQPRNATSPQNFSGTLIDDGSFEVDVTGQDSIRLTVINGVTIVFTFTIKARANMGNLLRGHNVAELSRIPRTTGLPQLDMLRRSQPTAFGLKPAAAQGAAQPVKKVIRRRPILRRKAAGSDGAMPPGAGSAMARRQQARLLRRRR